MQLYIFWLQNVQLKTLLKGRNRICIGWLLRNISVSRVAHFLRFSLPSTLLPGAIFFCVFSVGGMLFGFSSCKTSLAFRLSESNSGNSMTPTAPIFF